jgi:Flp pilus assembly protein TadG
MKSQSCIHHRSGRQFVMTVPDTTSHTVKWARWRSHGTRSGSHTRRSAFRGQALVELTVIGSLMLVMAFATVEIGRAYYGAIKVTHAARDGARYGMNPDVTVPQIQMRVVNAASPLSLATTSVSRNSTTVTVTASYVFTTNAPLLNLIIPGGNITISRTAVARVAS